MHQSEKRGFLEINGKKIPENSLSMMLHLDKQKLSKSLGKMRDLGIFSETESGVIYCRRMVRDEEIRQIRKEAGKKGGNPNLLNQKTTPSKEDEVEDNITEFELEGEFVREGGIDMLERIDRMSKWFNRKPTTKWSEKEIKRLKALGDIDREDFELMERYYTSSAKYKRREIYTLLNNWPGELDRARQWNDPMGGSTSNKGTHGF